MRVRIRGRSFEITQAVREDADRMIRFTMSRFAGAVEDVSLTLEEPGKRSSGTVFRCRVSVRLAPRGHLSVTHAAGEASAAIDGARLPDGAEEAATPSASHPCSDRTGQ
jgi:hypothetical protein